VMNQIKFPEEDNDDIPIVCPSTFPFVIMKKYIANTHQDSRGVLLILSEFCA
jgi:hypothetical protein